MIAIRNKKSFTLVEILITVFVAGLILAAVWSIYLMVWTWWYEVSPRIDAQRIARLAISKITEGTQDPTTGQDIIGGFGFKRKNGIASTFYFFPDLPNPQYDADGIPYSNRIDYGLYDDYLTYEPSSSNNVRSFYMATDPDTQLKAVYYKDGQAVIHKIGATLGITDLKFQNYVIDRVAKIQDPYVIVVTATVEKDVNIAGSAPYHIKVEYSDYVFLKNVL